jgi:hypothetical protein
MAAPKNLFDRDMKDPGDLGGSGARRCPGGWALAALDCALDTTTPAREATATLLATFAPFERRLISQRTREALAGRPARSAADHVPVRDRPDQARAKSRQEPGRDRERTQRGSHPHRPGRPPLVPGDHPVHTQPNNLTLPPVAECGNRDARDTRSEGQPLLARTDQRNGLPTIRSNPHSFRARAASDGQ